MPEDQRLVRMTFQSAPNMKRENLHGVFMAQVCSRGVALCPKRSIIDRENDADRRRLGSPEDRPAVQFVPVQIETQWHR